MDQWYYESSYNQYHRTLLCVLLFSKRKYENLSVEYNNLSIQYHLNKFWPNCRHQVGKKGR